MKSRQNDSNSKPQPAIESRLPGAAPGLCLAAVALASLLSGCAAFRPVDGVPARYLPDELRGCSKETMQMIDLSMLRRRPESQYRVDTGDVLAVYIENILGRADQPPINQQTGSTTSQLNGNRPPTLGYPLSVRDDGTIAIPRFGPILVRGRTIPEVESLVRSAFTQQQRYLPMQNNRVVVICISRGSIACWCFARILRTARWPRSTSATETSAARIEATGKLSRCHQVRTTCCTHWSSPVACRVSTHATRSG